MAVLYAVGNELIDAEELADLGARGDLALLEGGHSVESSVGPLEVRTLRTTVTPQGVPFESIGLGRPLSIRLHTVYVGELPGRRKDILAVSGVKGAATFDGVGRVINLLQERVPERSLAEISAFSKGSPIVYYVPSLTDADIRCSFEVVPDTFKEGTFNQVANLFTLAGGLPIFAPAATYLLAGSFLTKIAVDLGKAFLEKGPILEETLELRFGIGGFPEFREGIYPIVNDSQRSLFQGYSAQIEGDKLVMKNQNGERYRGEAPYLIIGVDGRQEPALESYTPLLASAALMERFYPTQGQAGVVLTELGEALALLNDAKFKKKADQVKARIDKLAADDPSRQELTELYDAYRKSIKSKEFEVPELDS